MKVRVCYTAQLRTALGRTEEEVELPSGSSLQALLVHLAERHPAAAAHLLAEPGRPRPSLLCAIKDAAIPIQHAAVTILNPNDIVTLLPPIAGG